MRPGDGPGEGAGCDTYGDLPGAGQLQRKEEAGIGGKAVHEKAGRRQSGKGHPGRAQRRGVSGRCADREADGAEAVRGNGHGTCFDRGGVMTDQEIIKALRCCASIASCYKCPFQTEMICRAMLKSAAADRLEELTENHSSVMMPKEDV